MTDDRLDPLIVCCNADHMSSAEAATEITNPLAIDVFEFGRVVESCIPILQLQVDVEQLAWLSSTLAEMSVVKYDTDDAERDKARSVSVKTHLFDSA